MNFHVNSPLLILLDTLIFLGEDMEFLANITRNSAIWISMLSCVSLQSAENSEIRDSSEWPTYRGNTSGTGYSPLEQITLDNVKNLEVVWKYSLRNDSLQAVRAVSYTHLTLPTKA